MGKYRLSSDPPVKNWQNGGQARSLCHYNISLHSYTTICGKACAKNDWKGESPVRRFFGCFAGAAWITVITDSAGMNGLCAAGGKLGWLPAAQAAGI